MSFRFKGKELSEKDSEDGVYHLTRFGIHYIFGKFSLENVGSENFKSDDVLLSKIKERAFNPHDVDFIEHNNQNLPRFTCKFFTCFNNAGENIKRIQDIGATIKNYKTTIHFARHLKEYFDSHGKIATYQNAKSRFSEMFLGVMLVPNEQRFDRQTLPRIKSTSKKYNNRAFSYDNDELDGADVIIMNPRSKGASYKKLPRVIEVTKSVLNIKNRDKMCFIWSVLACIYPAKNNPSSVSSYRKYFNTLNGEYNFPISPNQIELFCEWNRLSLRIWTITPDMSSIYVLNDYQDESNPEPINLLLFDGHYSLIKKIDVLISMIKGSKTYVCQYCAKCSFSSLLALERHINICAVFDNEVLFKLSEKEIVKFSNNDKKLKVPIVIYADFECMLSPVNLNAGENTTKTAEHIPIAYGLCLKSGSILYEKYESGIGSELLFVQEILKISSMIKAKYLNLLPIESGESQICCICKKMVSSTVIIYDTSFEIENKRVKLGEGHLTCRNKLYKKLITIPVIFHNLKGYDSHLFIDKLAMLTKYFTCIPISKEKYISFNAMTNDGVTLKFLDSMGFLSGSLSSNAERLSCMRFIGKAQSNLSMDGLEEMDTKLPFPYEYITNERVLMETELPNIKNWYSSLKDYTPTQVEIDKAVETFKKMNCKTIKDYMMLYLRLDVLLLLEIFEAFRANTISETSLEPLNYFTTPGLAWDSALMKSKQKLELLKTHDLVSFFIEKGVIRGGISTPSELKYHEINKTSIHYFDVTNLYGFAMTFPLPYGGFEFLGEVSNWKQIIENWTLESSVGYFFEVDMKYPRELEELHSPLPFMVENVNGKLIPILRDKLNYRCHILILKQAIQNGLEVLKIHRILKFSQSPWLKDYVMGNTEKRSKTSDENLRNFYKLMNNAVYGKTMENILNRPSIKIVSAHDKDRIQKLQRVENIQDIDFLTENLLAVSCKRQPVDFDKPIYVGFTILEISKYHMYDLLYGKIKTKWPSTKLMYMDTDSLIVKIDDEKIDYEGIESHFDLSCYSDNRYDPKNKGVLGTLKDEYPKDPIKRFICLKSKCYALQTKSGKVQMKNKGTSNIKSLTFEDYIEVLNAEVNLKDKRILVEQKSFRSFNHKIFTVNLKKIALKSLDDKRQRTDHNYKTKPL